jgi:DNA-directed RNA polymerase subunit M/transcription elongation factor TFIIS
MEADDPGSTTTPVVPPNDPPSDPPATGSEKMMSEERRAEAARIQEENLFETLAAGESWTETDLFTCGRCKQRKCRYRQAQTRPVDEPMTVRARRDLRRAAGC